MTNPQHEALVEALPDYIDLFRIIRRAGRKDAAKAKAVYDTLAALSATAATPSEDHIRDAPKKVGNSDLSSEGLNTTKPLARDDSDEVVRLRELVRRARNNVPEFYVEWHVAARAALEPQGKDV
jgi:hypothetical protein